VQKVYQQNGQPVPDELRSSIEALQKAMQTEDRDHIQELTAELQKRTATAATQEKENSDHDSSAGEDVVEGEFRDA
jgi:Sec-independent protein translocase protein TatA